MNTFVEIVLEAERESVKEFMREEALRAAMRAAAQASLAQKTALRQEPGRQEHAWASGAVSLRSSS